MIARTPPPSNLAAEVQRKIDALPPVDLFDEDRASRRIHEIDRIWFEVFGHEVGIIERLSLEGGSQPATSTPTGSQCDIVPDEARRRAAAYVAAVPGAAMGNRNNIAYRLAATIARDFAQPDEDVYCLMDEWNGRCIPPLDGAELQTVTGNGIAGAIGDRGSKLRVTPGREELEGMSEFSQRGDLYCENSDTEALLDRFGAYGRRSCPDPVPVLLRKTADPKRHRWTGVSCESSTCVFCRAEKLVEHERRIRPHLLQSEHISRLSISSTAYEAIYRKIRRRDGFAVRIQHPSGRFIVFTDTQGLPGAEEIPAGDRLEALRKSLETTRQYSGKGSRLVTHPIAWVHEAAKEEKSEKEFEAVARGFPGQDTEAITNRIEAEAATFGVDFTRDHEGFTLDPLSEHYDHILGFAGVSVYRTTSPPVRSRAAPSRLADMEDLWQAA